MARRRIEGCDYDTHWKLVAKLDRFSGLVAMVQQMNVLYPPDASWEHSRSRTERQDLFGDVIGTGAYYFHRHRTDQFYQVLSVRSMRRMVQFLLEANEPLAQVIWRLNGIRDRKTAAALQTIFNRVARVHRRHARRMASGDGTATP